MNIPFEMRPVNSRLRIAHIVDAINDGFQQCDPGNTFTRFIAGQSDSSNSNEWDVLRNDHPYSRMWRTIAKHYNDQRWYELSDTELNDLFNTFRSVGFNHGNTHVPGTRVMDAKRRWDENGWNRYETKRNGRRSVMYKWAPMAVVACFGITLPME